MNIFDVDVVFPRRFGSQANVERSSMKVILVKIERSLSWIMRLGKLIRPVTVHVQLCHRVKLFYRIHVSNAIQSHPEKARVTITDNRARSKQENQQTGVQMTTVLSRAWLLCQMEENKGADMNF